MKTIIFIHIELITLIVVPLLTLGQINKLTDTVVVSENISHIGDQIEKTAEALEMQNDYSNLVEDLIELSEKPVNLNAVQEDELNKIPFLTPAQREDLIKYLTTYGEVLSIYELQSISGFDSVLIRKISPFISISRPSNSPTPSPKNLLRFGRHNFLVRYEQTFPKSAGYLADDSARAANPGSFYPGSPQRYYFRYNYTWFDKLRIGIAGEKDPGEQFFQGAQRNGLDFYAVYLCLSNIGILKNLTIGNFRASFGQGLTMGSGLSLGSVPGFSTNISVSGGIRPSTGMSEGSYLRGLAATIKSKRFEISGFASYHPRDASSIKADSTTSEVSEISSFATTGYHRTGQELAKRNALKEFVGGGNINFSMAPNQQFGFKIGLTGLYCAYSAQLAPKIYPYNQFGFRGNQNLNTGFDLQIRYHGFYFFGEVSRSSNNGLAWLAGAILNPDSRVCITVIYRNYQTTYQNLFSNAFGQNSNNANERGIYAAINAAVHPKVTVSGYMDFFTFPWIKYRVDAPTIGQEFGMLLGWQASGNVKITLRFYQKNLRGNEATDPGQNIHELCDNLTRSYRLGIEWLPVNGIMFRTRIEIKESGESTRNRPLGYLLYQEAQFKLFKWLETTTLRFALFDVPHYTSRIYVYEPEVLFGYSVPAYQGRGLRTCLVMKFGITRKIDFWFRGGITYYSDRNEAGSGLDLTKGNLRGELTVQLLVRL
jgi:hypothetical protein